MGRADQQATRCGAAPQPQATGHRPSPPICQVAPHCVVDRHPTLACTSRQGHIRMFDCPQHRLQQRPTSAPGESSHGTVRPRAVDPPPGLRRGRTPLPDSPRRWRHGEAAAGCGRQRSRRGRAGACSRHHPRLLPSHCPVEAQTPSSSSLHRVHAHAGAPRTENTSGLETRCKTSCRHCVLQRFVAGVTGERGQHLRHAKLCRQKRDGGSICHG